MEWKFKYYDIKTGIDWDGLERDCQWFRDLKETPQDKVWHAEGDVQIHTKMVCKALLSFNEFKSLNDQEKHIMVTASLMHDIAKPKTTKEELRDGRMCIVAPRHAKVGEPIARELLYMEYDCSFHIREQICKIVRYHGVPLHEDISSKELANMSTMIKLSWLAMFSKADILGRICNDEAEQLEQIEMFKLYAEEMDCLIQPKTFCSNLARYIYLSKDGYIDYTPYDDTEFEVIMMSALPGSGKDTYIKNHLSNYPVVSLDAIRNELGVSPTDTSGNGRVIQLAKERAKEFMRKHISFVWNATNITAQLRGQLIDLFTSYRGRVKIIYLEVPYKKLLKQNDNRVAFVPVNVIDRMIGKLQPPLFEEAHDINYIIMK